MPEIAAANEKIEKFGLAFYHDDSGSCNTCGLTYQCIASSGRSCPYIMHAYIGDISYVWFRKLRPDADIEGLIEEAIAIRSMEELHA